MNITIDDLHPGDRWQLADGRRVIVDELQGNTVRCSLVQHIGIGGAPAFFTLLLTVDDFTGARRW